MTHELDRATLWPYDERGEPREFYYSRYGGPTLAAVERELGALEGGEALLFPSGAGATTALVLSLLRPGDTIALAAGAYFGTGRGYEDMQHLGGTDSIDYLDACRFAPHRACRNRKPLAR